MANDLIHIDNAETGVNETRVMTKAEQAILDADRQAAKAEQDAKAEAALQAETDKAALLAKLAALGLTTDDLKALGLGTN